ncbi:MAG: hypothetical protein HYY40_02045 [Bacteroidetes bacterium]|nr:hypothetical protein [Bacteroidota bacterium]
MPAKEINTAFVKDKGSHKDLADISIEQRLRAIFELQLIDSKIDAIRSTLGELPLEVRDLEDDVTGLETRISNANTDLENLENAMKLKRNDIKDAQELIKKYQGQLAKVKNSREYDSLNKELEYQKLEIQVLEKKIKDLKTSYDAKKTQIEETEGLLKERKNDLKHKQNELNDMIAETKKGEEALMKKSASAQKLIEDRLLAAYKRIRSNARNGLSVVKVQRDACGGCFNKIPPQRQLDIRSRKKIIVCEHCGRILVDPELSDSVESKMSMQED